MGTLDAAHTKTPSVLLSLSLEGDPCITVIPDPDRESIPWRWGTPLALSGVEEPAPAKTEGRPNGLGRASNPLPSHSEAPRGIRGEVPSLPSVPN